MKNEQKVYGVYKCEVFRKGGEFQLADLRPVRLEDKGKEGQTKTTKIYPHEADVMNHGVGSAPRWNAVSRLGLVYLTAEEFKEVTGEDDKSFPVEEKPERRGRPKKEEKKEEPKQK